MASGRAAFAFAVVAEAGADQQIASELAGGGPAGWYFAILPR